MYESNTINDPAAGIILLLSIVGFLVSYVALIAEGFKIHWGWGIGNFSLSIPFSFIFGVMYWQERKVKFWFLIWVFSVLGLIYSDHLLLLDMLRLLF